MGISGEVANIHMRTDAKNLVTTARTIPWRETIHMISMLRKEACSGSAPFFLNRHPLFFPSDSRIAYFGLLVRQIQTLARAYLDRPR